MDQRCPRKLDSLPCTSCPMGKNKAERMKTGRYNIEKLLDNECVWYVDDDNSHYCFFKYIEDNKNKEHSLKEIAELCGTSINNIKLRETEAISNLKDKMVKNCKHIIDEEEI